MQRCPRRSRHPQRSTSFVQETAKILQKARLADAARELSDIQSTAWTTSSEWLELLGLAVARVKAYDVPDEVIPRLRRIHKAASAAGR